ncbi:prepilin-type N-terminal cleavage/methylation domain-containing protein [PVC group bacterium]|nr:prepilin-type N-terminal cleavage/methylation domain-containing protein [PVC group bacterium]
MGSSSGRFRESFKVFFKKDSKKAFTLIELLIVVVIVSILVVITVPRFRGSFEFIRFENSVRNFTKLVRYGQDLAVIYRRHYRLKVEEREGAFWLEHEGKTKGRFEKVSGKWGKKYFIPSFVDLKTDKKEYVFYLDGRSQTGEVEFEFRDRYTYTVKLLGTRGHVEIIEETNRQ